MQPDYQPPLTNRAGQSKTFSQGTSDSDRWIELFGRLGYSAKGGVYLIIGTLALMQLMGWGGDVTGSKGALLSLKQQPYGTFLLWVIAVGLFAYTAWRWAQGFLDVENQGTEKEDWVKRVGFIISGGLYAVLAVIAIRLALDSSGGGGGQYSEEGASKAMSFPGGAFLVIAAGIGFFIAGLCLMWRAYALKFTDHWKASLSGTLRTWATRISRFGIAARAAVFLVMGAYIAKAGFEAQAEQVKGLRETLQSFSDQPWLLGIVAAGLVCYALYCGINAVYRRIPAN